MGGIPAPTSFRFAYRAIATNELKLVEIKNPPVRTGAYE